MSQISKTRRKTPVIQLLIFIAFIFSNQVKAQAGFDIVAAVTDEKGEPLFGNLLLLYPADSMLIKGTYFMEGKVAISGVKETSVLVKFTSMGYKDTLLEVNNSPFKKVVDLGAIKLQQSSMNLEEVTVVGSVPLFESSPDGSLKVNVQKTMLAASSSAKEILSKSPNVQVGENGLAVVGKGEAILYLDGNKSLLKG